MKTHRIIIAISILIFSAFNAFSQGIKYPKNDTIKYIIRNEPTRFFGGTFWTGIEIPIQNKNSFIISGIVTYGSPTSSNQHRMGWGGEIQYRNYLGKGSFSTNFPIYIAPQLMVRRIEEFQLRDIYYPIYQNGTFIRDESYQMESSRGFTVFYGGLLLGAQVFVNNIFTVDINFGGGLRLTRENHANTFTRYKDLTDLDYSGVVPRIGIQIGIIQH
jgi:hypothetical protein